MLVLVPEIKVLPMSGHCPGFLVMKFGWRFLAKSFRPSDLLGQVQAIVPAGLAVDITGVRDNGLF
jgi:hypothetical protein